MRANAPFNKIIQNTNLIKIIIKTKMTKKKKP